MSDKPIIEDLEGQWLLGKHDAWVSDPLVAEDNISGNHGTIVGDGFYVAASLEGRTCLSFDGSKDQYVDLDAFRSTLSGQNAGSLSMWFKASSVTADEVLFGWYEDDNNRGYAQLTGSGALQVNNHVAGSWLNPTKTQTTFQAGQWYNVLWTFEFGEIKCYVNGQPETVINPTLDNSPLAIGTNKLLIGASYWNGAVQSSLTFDGFIDDVRIWSRVLTASEAAALYASPEPYFVDMNASQSEHGNGQMSPLGWQVGNQYLDPGATCIDALGTNVTANIVVSGDVVNGNVEGDYFVVYNIEDGSGNTIPGYGLTRLVQVQDLAASQGRTYTTIMGLSDTPASTTSFALPSPNLGWAAFTGDGVVYTSATGLDGEWSYAETGVALDYGSQANEVLLRAGGWWAVHAGNWPAWQAGPLPTADWNEDPENGPSFAIMYEGRNPDALIGLVFDEQTNQSTGYVSNNASAQNPLSWTALASGQALPGLDAGTDLIPRWGASNAAGTHIVLAADATQSNAMTTRILRNDSRSLVSHLKLDGYIDGNGSAQIFDNNGAFTNTVNFQAGQVGQAAVYDNTNDLGATIGFPGVTLGGGPQSALSFGGDITISMWLKNSDSANGFRVWSDWNVGQRNLLWVWSPDDGGRMSAGSGVSGGAFDPNGTAYSALPPYTDYTVQGWGSVPQGPGTWLRAQCPELLDTNQWVHCVLQRDGNNLRLFINGSEVTYYTANDWVTTLANVDITGALGSTTDHDVGLCCNLEHHGSLLAGTPSEAGMHQGSTFSGQIDDVGVWDRTLSSTEISDIYNAGLSGDSLDTTPIDLVSSTFDWEDISGSLPAGVTELHRPRFHPSAYDGNGIWLMGADSGCLGSADDGVNWQLLTFDADGEQVCIQDTACVGDTMILVGGVYGQYGGAQMGHVIRTEDGGDTWAIVASNTTILTTIAVSQPDSGHATWLVGGEDGIVGLSVSDGLEWTNVNDMSAPLNLLDDAVVYLPFEDSITNETESPHTFTYVPEDGPATPTFTDDGKVGKAIHFTGDEPNSGRLVCHQTYVGNGLSGSDHRWTGGVLGGGDFTWSGWVYYDSADVAKSVILASDWTAIGRNFYCSIQGDYSNEAANKLFIMTGDGGQLSPGPDNGSGQFTSQEQRQVQFVSHAEFPRDEWVHVVVQRKGNESGDYDGHIHVYLNGQPWSMGLSAGGVHDQTPSTQILGAGNEDAQGRDWTAGGDTSNLWSVAGEYQSQFYPNGMPGGFTLTAGHPGYAIQDANGRWHNNFAVGQHPSWGGSRVGKLDDVGIWSRALEPSDIAAIYAAGFQVPAQGLGEVDAPTTIDLTPNLVAHLKLDDDLSDSYGNTNAYSFDHSGAWTNGLQWTNSFGNPYGIGGSVVVGGLANDQVIAFPPGEVSFAGDMTISMWLELDSSAAASHTRGHARLWSDWDYQHRNVGIWIVFDDRYGGTHLISGGSGDGGEGQEPGATVTVDLSGRFHFVWQRENGVVRIFINGDRGVHYSDLANGVLTDGQFEPGDSGGSEGGLNGGATNHIVAVGGATEMDGSSIHPDGNEGLEKWPGLIDDLGVWDTALNEEDIRAIYEAGLQGNNLEEIEVAISRIAAVKYGDQ